ncbi:TIGR01459 family HAD-type hydrolase [Stappia stellulata]|uniref:TIGR01459 family HAD-type hydrolase n=1 Tax=Stappia stellulata TaxID=71235 RepID=UPI0003F8020A|nr:TIGR01459 family HAD-type hydrolase [Stappia stellulata]
MSPRDGAGGAEAATRAYGPWSESGPADGGLSLQVPPVNVTEPRRLAGLGGLFDDAARAEAPCAVLVDVWGVVTDGVRAYPSAIRALERLRERRVPVVLVSNTSRRGEDLARLLQEQGLAPDLYAAVITGGGLAFEQLSDEVARRRRCGGDALRCVVVGTQPGGDWARDAGLACVDSPDAADLLLGFGVLGHGDPRADAPLPVPDVETRRLLRAAARAGLPLVLTNADTCVRIAGSLHLGIGALAPVYQSFGGTVRIYGKPALEIYSAALAAVGSADPVRALMIGDTLATDIAGARAAGIPTVLVTGSGSHAHELHAGPQGRLCLDALAGLVERTRVRPHHVMEAMQW